MYGSRAIAAILLISAFGSPEIATAQAPAPAEPTTKRHIGVVNLLPDRLEVSLVGTTVFTNSHYYGDVDWWQINRHVTGVLSDQLTRTGRIAVKEVPFDRAELLKEYADAVWSKVGTLRDRGAKLIAEHQLDGIVMVVPAGRTGPLCRTEPGCIGYGNAGTGIYSVIASAGPHRARRGDYLYVSVLFVYVPKETPDREQVAVAAAINPAVFNKSKEFIGIPAPDLVQYERMIKNLLNKEIPLSVVALNVLNAPLEAQAPIDLRAFPKLVINNECCATFPRVPESILEGYAKAATEGKATLGEEQATLRLVKVWASVPGGFMKPPRGENRIEGTLSFRGNEYMIAMTTNPFDDIHVLANSIGEASFGRLLGKPVDSYGTKPPALPKAAH